MYEAVIHDLVSCIVRTLEDRIRHDLLRLRQENKHQLSIHEEKPEAMTVFVERGLQIPPFNHGGEVFNNLPSSDSNEIKPQLSHGELNFQYCLEVLYSLRNAASRWYAGCASMGIT